MIHLQFPNTERRRMSGIAGFPLFRLGKRETMQISKPGNRCTTLLSIPAQKNTSFVRDGRFACEKPAHSMPLCLWTAKDAERRTRFKSHSSRSWHLEIPQSHSDPETCSQIIRKPSCQAYWSEICMLCGFQLQFSLVIKNGCAIAHMKLKVWIKFSCIENCLTRSWWCIFSVVLICHKTVTKLAIIVKVSAIQAEGALAKFRQLSWFQLSGCTIFRHVLKSCNKLVL